LVVQEEMEGRSTGAHGQGSAVGARIRRRREQLGLKQEITAHRIGRSRRWLVDVEAGRGDPTLSDLLALADVLETHLEWLLADLFDVPDGSGSARHAGTLDGEEEITRRRTFNRLAFLSMLGAAAGMIDLDRLASFDVERPVDGAIVDDLSLVTDSYARQWKVLPPGRLLPGVHDHLRLLGGLRTREEQRLRALTADTAVLAGYLAFQLEDRGRAAAYWTIGRERSRDIGGETRARVLVALSALRSQLAHGRAGASAASVALLDGAQHSAGPRASRLLRAWAFARRAEERAALGDGPAADHDIEAADACLNEPQPCSDAIVGPRDGSQLDGFTGHCALLLGRVEAAGILRRSLDSMPTEMVAWRSVVHCDLAAALADRAEVEAACVSLSKAFSLAAEVGAAEHVQRIHGIRRRLDRYADASAVRQLDELIAL
jgi:transcriptional regulator with XRE-family HTH domain